MQAKAYSNPIESGPAPHRNVNESMRQRSLCSLALLDGWADEIAKSPRSGRISTVLVRAFINSQMEGGAKSLKLMHAYQINDFDSADPESGLEIVAASYYYLPL